ncbi:MAG: [LysW]-aminoadipate kinase [Candidatus Hermodarchaeota archaeon]
MIIVKIGGGKTINLESIIADLAQIQEPFLIVHGANALRDEIAEALGKPKKVLTSISGYSSTYSDKDSIDILIMAYAGLRNKRIVELCHQYRINAVGLSGLDGKLIQGRRNRGIRIRENNKTKIIRDFSGKPDKVNLSFLNLLLENCFVPVLSVPIIDENNNAINSENDDIVTLLQHSLQAETIIQLIEARGFLDNKNDPLSLVSRISVSELIEREEQVEGRMKRKILALRKLLDNGSTKVIISDGRVEHPIQDALAGKGTIIN